MCKQGAVVSTCVRKKPGLSHPTSVARARKPRKAREKGKQGGAFTEGRNWLISYLPAECANPGLKISMGKTIH